MIEINKYTLKNGLRIVHSLDETTPMVCVNIAYNVGARDENPTRTGFAHLFEHLMFGGSVNVADFDVPLQNAGASNNAWTNNDMTNYYVTIPAQNLETAFWLESDRMLALDFSQRSLDVQKQVVVEEFKQRNLNQPYGDVFPLLRELAYKVHPYRWSTIGREVSHIENAELEDVKAFFYQHYAPNNAVMAVVGNVSFDEVVRLAEKWFAPIPYREITERNIPQEPLQNQPRFLEVERNVPADKLYKTFHMPQRMHPDYPVYDLISDILSNGNSSRLYRTLVQERVVFSEVDAWVSDSFDPGLFYLSAKPNDGISLKQADDILMEEINRLTEEPISEYEMQKVKNKFESIQVFSEMNYQGKATNLAYFELLGNAEFINSEVERYCSVTVSQVQSVAKKLFAKENSCTMYYHASK